MKKEKSERNERQMKGKMKVRWKETKDKGRSIICGILGGHVTKTKRTATKISLSM